MNGDDVSRGLTHFGWDVLVVVAGGVVLVASGDPWMAVPFLVWLLGYTLLLRHYIPKLAKVAEQQADSRSIR